MKFFSNTLGNLTKPITNSLGITKDKKGNSGGLLSIFNPIKMTSGITGGFAGSIFGIKSSSKPKPNNNPVTSSARDILRGKRPTVIRPVNKPTT